MSIPSDSFRSSKRAWAVVASAMYALTLFLVCLAMRSIRHLFGLDILAGGRVVSFVFISTKVLQLFYGVKPYRNLLRCIFNWARI